MDSTLLWVALALVAVGVLIAICSHYRSRSRGRRYRGGSSYSSDSGTDWSFFDNFGDGGGSSGDCGSYGSDGGCDAGGCDGGCD
jgi:hypothetical protein